MIRIRVWLLIALVAAALGLNFGRLSPRIAQSAEDSIRARLASSTNALHAQLELRDVQLSPRQATMSSELVEALRPPADPTLPVPKPDEKALRAAAAAMQPREPDLLIVATGDGAVYSRRGKAATQLDDVKDLPLVKSTLDGQQGAPAFAMFEGGLYRVQSARIPGSVGVVVVGLLVDDRLATQLRAATDVDVTFFREGAIAASSLPDDARAPLSAWAKAPGLGYGTIQLRLPLVGSALDGKLPRGAARYAVRAARAPLESGVMAALTLSSRSYLGWLGRYQAFYILGVALFLLFGVVCALWPSRKVKAPAISAAPAISDRVSAAASRAAATIAGANDAGPKPSLPSEVPWTEGSAGSVSRPPVGPRAEPVELHAAPMPHDHHEESATDLVEKPAPSPESLPFPIASEEELHEASLPHVPPVAPLAADLDPFAFEAPAPAIPSLPAEFEAAAAAQLPELEPLPEEVPAPIETPIAPAAVVPEFVAAPAHDEPHAEPESTPPAAPHMDDLAQTGELGQTAEHVHAEQAPASPAEFSFASMLDQAGPEQHEHAQAVDEAPANHDEMPSLGEPAASNDDQQHTHAASDEPTRVEAVSAALLDKLRERDENEPPAQSPVEAEEETSPAAAETVPAETGEAAPEAPHAQEGEAPPEAPAADSEVAEAEVAYAEDPDEAHFLETYQQFIEMRSQTGEPADRVSYEKFTAKLRRNRDELLAKHGARGVRFSVYIKDGRAAIKASALR